MARKNKRDRSYQPTKEQERRVELLNKKYFRNMPKNRRG